MKKILIRGGALVEASELREADIVIENEKIISISAPAHSSKLTAQNFEIINASGLLVLPLLIDCHVHFREPGMDYKATMETEAAAALAGGIGTVCEMPNTIPPTVTIAALADKVRRAEKIAGLRM